MGEERCRVGQEEIQQINSSSSFPLLDYSTLWVVPHGLSRQQAAGWIFSKMCRLLIWYHYIRCPSFQLHVLFSSLSLPWGYISQWSIALLRALFSMDFQDTGFSSTAVGCTPTPLLQLFSLRLPMISLQNWMNIFQFLFRLNSPLHLTFLPFLPVHHHNLFPWFSSHLLNTAIYIIHVPFP